MSKATFIKIVKLLENKTILEVKNENYKWELLFNIDNDKFYGLVYRISKNNKELINHYHNSIGFYDKLMRIAEIKNLQIVDTELN